MSIRMVHNIHYSIAYTLCLRRYRDSHNDFVTVKCHYCYILSQWDSMHEHANILASSLQSSWKPEMRAVVQPSTGTSNILLSIVTSPAVQPSGFILMVCWPGVSISQSGDSPACHMERKTNVGHWCKGHHFKHDIYTLFEETAIGWCARHADMIISNCYHIFTNSHYARIVCCS